MTYAMLPPLAGLAALGLHRLCALAGSQSSSIAGTLVATVLALHVATVAGIASAITSGGVAMPSITRLDIAQDDPTPPLPEPWLPAYAVDESGKLLCAERRPVVLHATYAYLENTYFGLDHRLHCGARNIRLTGTTPATAAHLVALAKPQWSALGWQPSTTMGGLGIANAAQVLSPEQGYAVPDGSVYPPFTRPQAPSRTLTLNAESGAGEALVISMPYYIWMPPAALKVEANGKRLPPTSRDAISTVYTCRRCAADNGVKWRIEIDSVAPEWIDVVTIAPTLTPRR
jgi:hypothetical protein